MINLADGGRSWASGEITYELAQPLFLFFGLFDISFHEIGIIIPKTVDIFDIIETLSAAYTR